MSKRDIVLWSGITAAVVGVVAAVSVTTQIVRTRRYRYTVSMDKPTDYNALAARAERGGFDVVPGTVLTGDAAAAAGRRLLCGERSED